MAQTVTAFFARYSELMRRRNLTAIAELHRFPFMIEVEDTTVVTMDPAELIAFLRDGFARLDAGQVKDVVAHVAAVEMPRGDRFRVWLRWTYCYEDREEPDGAGMIYYLVRSGSGRLALEMMAFISMAPIEAAARESARIA